MPDLNDYLRQLNLLGSNTTQPQTNTTPAETTNPGGLTAGDIALFKSLNIDKVLTSTATSGLANVGYSNESFDPDRADINQQISNSWLQNAYGTFRRSWLDMNIATEIGKMNLDAGEFGTGTVFGISQGAEEIVDNYPNEIKKLDNQRETGTITEADYLEKVQNLQESFNNAQKIVSEGYSEIAENEAKKKDYVVSNAYAAKTQRALQKGDDLGFIENMAYAFPQTFGSSASLMIPQMAAAFGSGFVKGATTTVASTLGVGSEAAPIVGTIAGIGSALATLTWGRAQESYGEVGGLIQEARDRMVVDYMKKNNLQDPSQVPEEVMVNIRNKSRQGSETLFKENMALVVPDLASALLLPMNTLGKTLNIGRGLKGTTGKVTELLSNAKNYNLWTKGLAFAANRRYAQLLEQFEEGFQYAATDRAKDEIYDLGKYENKGFIKSLLDDSYNTVASLNYTLMPGITPSLRGSGKYALDPEFQASDNSGALLALAMSAPTSAVSIGSELMAYRRANQDIIKNGLFDVDSKFERLNASLLKSYFEKGQTQRLVEAIKVVGRQKDTDGNQYYTEAEGTKAINDIKELYSAYSNISNNIDNIMKDNFFGFKSSKEQKAMKNLAKEDLFTTVMNLKRQSEQLGDLQADYTTALSNDIVTGEDTQTANLKDLRAKQQVLEELIQLHTENSDVVSNTAPKNILSNLKNILNNEILPAIEQEESLLADLDLNIDSISEPSLALKEANKNLYVQSEYIKDQKSNYSELSKIRTQQDLLNYYNKNKSRTNLADVAERITGVEEDNPVTETRTSEEVVMDETDNYDPTPANQDQPSGPVITEDFINNIMNQPVEDEVFTPTGNIVQDTYNLAQIENAKQRKKFKETLEEMLSVAEIDTPSLSSLLKDNGIDLRNNTFEATWNELKGLVEDPNLLKDKFNDIRELVLSEQVDDNLIKDTEVASLEGNSIELSGKSPFHSYNDSNIDSNNKKVEEDFKQVLEPNPTPGFKIIDPMSIANRQVGFDGRQDSYENGKLIFKDSGDDQHITNTSLVKPGTTVTISIENPIILDEINVDTDLDTDLNRLELGIFITNTSEGITIPLKIGSLHTTDYFTIESFDPSEMSIEEAKNQIRFQRKRILTELKKNPNAVFESTVVSKGFGHLNLNQTPNSVRNVIGDDTRPYLTIISDSGLPIQVSGKSTYQGIKSFEKGASMLMIPNDVNGETKYIPVYLKKQPISTDSNALREVTASIENFLKGRDNVWASELDDWLYVTRNPAEKRKLVNNGVVLENKKLRGEKSVTINNITYSYNRNNNTYSIQGTSGEPIVTNEQEFYNGLNRQGISLPGLNNLIGNLYPSLNKNRLLNPKDNNGVYQKKMMNSSVYQTRVAPNTVLLDKSTDLYNFLPENEQYQYFSQHTVTLDPTLQIVGSNTIKPEVEVNTQEETNTTTDTPDTLSTEEDIQEALGDDFIFDIDAQNPQDLPSIRQGVSSIFEQNSELASIGTPQQYSEYLNTIFPNSWNNNILYRGVGEIRDDNFRIGTQGDNIRDWNFFTNNLGKAQDYGENIIPVILNMSNLDNAQELNYKGASSYIDNDSAFVAMQGGDEFVVRNTDQIHILGFQKDIEGFRNFVNSSLDVDSNSNPVSTTTRLKEEIYISKDNMPYSVQQEVVSSVAYMLLNNNPDTDTNETNTDRVKKEFETRYNKANAVLEKTTTDSPAFEKLYNLVSYYRTSLDNWDKVISKAKETLERIGFVSNEESDYYDNLEDAIDNTEESENVQFNDDSARTRNIIDFIPSEVKKLMSFIPAYRKLDPTVASDRAIIESKGIEYTPEGNSLGLSYFNDFNDTWTKTLTLLSTRYFDSDRNTGWTKMLNTLLDKSNPIVVQELAKKLQSVPSKVQNAFFTSTNLQLQHNLTTKSELKDFTTDNIRSTQKTTRVIASDRTAGIKKIVNQLRQEFNNSPSTDIIVNGVNIKGNILTRSVDSITGKVINIINTDFGKVLHTELLKILKDRNSFETYTKANGQIVASNNFIPDVQRDIYNLVLAAGINISPNAFNDFLKTFKEENSEIVSPRATVQSLFESRLFKTLAGESKRSSETDDTSRTDNDKNNPFISDTSVINSLAYYEFKYRNNLQQGAFRQDGKSYYPFIRHHYLSEKFTNMVEAITQNQDKSEFKNILTTDNFASTSGILQDVIVGKLNNLELDYELGSKLTNSESGVKLLKEMNEREHQITKMSMFQNSGNKSAYFFYDTLSDKSTMPLIKRNRIETEYNFEGSSIDEGNIVLSDTTMDELYRYFENEYKRIRKVEIENDTLEADKRIKGYHNQGKKEGMGSKFLIYSFLNKAMLDVDNPELSGLLYNDNGRLKDINGTGIDMIKQAINNHFNYIFMINKEDMRSLGLFNQDNTKTFKGDFYAMIDRNYLMKGNSNSIANKIGIVNNPNYKSFTKSNDASKLGQVDFNKVVDYAVIDYVVNYAAKSNEMLQLTGDPAQMGKLEKISYKEESDRGTQIRNKYKNQPNADLLEAKDILQLHVNSTLINVNKRNAAFLGSGSKGLFNLPEYNVAIANDISINSNQVDEYKALFPGREDEIEDKYVNGDIADAQEFTTVKEHLNVMLAFAKITPEQFKKALYIYDRQEYNNTYTGQSESMSQQDKETLFKVIFQPAKPVQRIGVLNSELQATKHYYIKTSSFPIFPDLVKGTPMESMLNDMKANKVDRVAFVSGVKLGVAGAKDLFDKEGNYNTGFFNNNVNTLNRNGFRIQLEVPYKAGKNAIREGTQQAKIIFVDINDDIDFTINGKTFKGSDLKSNYKRLHQDIFNLKLQEFVDEVNIEYDYTNDKFKFNNLNKLAEVLQREAIDRGYGLNSILGLDINQNGRFKIPLTFSPVAGKIEPVITAIVSNRLAKMKLPGHSYIQGSEFILTTGKKGEIKSDEVLKDQRNIIWTDPKYANTTKLQYLRNEDNTIKGAQIVIAPYFVIGGQKLDIRNFTKEVDGSTYIDTSKVDPTLLAMNGFRIPFQGHNSGMWFEIIGFLPEEAGDLAIVPGEIAAQMGSDYDVDKLYSYMYNYYYSGNRIVKIDDNTTLEQINKNVARNRKYVEDEMGIKGVSRQEALDGLGMDNSELEDITQNDLEIMKRQNSIIDIHQAVYTNKDLLTSVLNPLSFDVVNQAISETEDLTPTVETEFTGVYDPLYQRTFYFSNKGGKLGTAISALANTSHAQAQISNLFIKGQGIVFEDAEGNIYQDTGNNSNRTNAYRKDLYTYMDPIGNEINQDSGTERSAWRLDKIYTFPDSKGRVFKISDLISQILGVSVDNAKEQVLGKFGINAQNFNTTLNIIRAGFDLVTVKNFINQPILSEYYQILDSLTDMYTIDYTADKKNKAIRELIDKYAKRYNLNTDANRLLARAYLVPTNVSRMEDALRAGEVNESNVSDQLEVLKSYLQYSDISDNLQALNRAFNMDSRGLPKNISDILKKTEDIGKIFSSPFIGNVNRYSSLSLPGVYGNLPFIASDLFTSETNPLFAYNSTTYRNINSSILEVTGRETLYSNQQDIVNNNIKQFIYTSFISSRENLEEFKNKVLFDTENSNSLVTRFNELYKKYPRDKFLSSLDTVTSIYPDNPKLLEIKMSSEDNYVQVISEAWEYAYSQNNDIELKDFALDLFKYALAISPQEFGTSSIIRYIPMVIMEDTGFTDYLDNTHNSLNDEYTVSQFETFTKQFLQHNPDFALSVRQEYIEEIYKADEDKQNIVKSFKLPPVNSENNKAQAIRRSNELGGYYYPTFLSFYTNPNIGKQVYEQIETPEGTFYFLLPKLGVNNVTEYNINNIDQTSLFEENRITTEVFIDSSAIMETLKGNSFTGQEEMNAMNANILLSKPRSVENTLQGIQAIANRYKSNQDSYLRKIGVYYGVLADKLNQLDYSDVTISYTTESNSRTSGDGKNIIINTGIANSADNKSKLNSELNAVRVILHELLHSAVFRKLASTKKDFDLIQTVYDEYRSSIWDSKDNVRGVNKDTFLGEVLGTLVDNFRNNNNTGSTDLDINNITIPSNLTDERLRDLLNKVSPKMKQLAREGKINSNEVLYNFSNDSDREKEFFDLIKANFVGANNFRNMINKFYPYTNINEFITESTTNPQTQMILKRIPGILERVRSVITDILRKLFGITSEERNLFQDAVDAVFNFISPEEIQQKEVTLPEAQIDLNIETNESQDIDFNDPSIIQQILRLPCA